MENIKVIVAGIGGVGTNLVGLLREKKGLDIVGVVDPAPDKAGKDAGVACGGAALGVTVAPDLAALLETVNADVIINTATPSSAEETYRQMLPAIEKGIDVIVANMGTCNLWSTEPELAKTVDAKCKEHGVSYLGIGATQMQDRFILAMTEGCSKINKITFTHFADMHAFSDDSVRHEWGVTLTEEEFHKGVADGSVESHEYFKDGIYYLGAHLGWTIDDVTYEMKPMVGDDKVVFGTTFKIQGFQKGEAKLETNWVFLRDPERRYYDEVIVDGTPHIDSMNKFTPDRGMVSTFASLANSIPFAIKAAPGYINSLEVPACTLIDDDYRNHI